MDSVTRDESARQHVQSRPITNKRETGTSVSAPKLEESDAAFWARVDAESKPKGSERDTQIRREEQMRQKQAYLARQNNAQRVHNSALDTGAGQGYGKQMMAPKSQLPRGFAEHMARLKAAEGLLPANDPRKKVRGSTPSREPEGHQRGHGRDNLVGKGGNRRVPAGLARRASGGRDDDEDVAGGAGEDGGSGSGGGGSGGGDDDGGKDGDIKEVEVVAEAGKEVAQPTSESPRTGIRRPVYISEDGIIDDLSRTQEGQQVLQNAVRVARELQAEREARLMAQQNEAERQWRRMEESRLTSFQRRRRRQERARNRAAGIPEPRYGGHEDEEHMLQIRDQEMERLAAEFRWGERLMEQGYAPLPMRPPRERTISHDVLLEYEADLKQALQGEAERERPARERTTSHNGLLVIPEQWGAQTTTMRSRSVPATFLAPEVTEEDLIEAPSDLEGFDLENLLTPRTLMQERPSHDAVDAGAISTYDEAAMIDTGLERLNALDLIVPNGPIQERSTQEQGDSVAAGTEDETALIEDVQRLHIDDGADMAELLENPW